jgi:hypothetical protein
VPGRNAPGLLMLARDRNQLRIGRQSILDPLASNDL